MPKFDSCLPYKPNETVYMMCVMLEQRDKVKAAAKAKKKKDQAEQMAKQQQ